MDSFIYALVLVPSLRELLPHSGIAATKGNVGYYGGLLFALFLCGWGLAFLWGPAGDKFGRVQRHPGAQARGVQPAAAGVGVRDQRDQIRLRNEGGGTFRSTAAENPNGKRPIVTLEVQTDDGAVGVGATYFGGALTGTLKSAVEELGALCVGEDPVRVEMVTAKLRAAAGSAGPGGIFNLAQSALDMATV